MCIRVRGARENNLQSVDVALPLGALTVFCGPSGSGKSSLAFDTVFAEGQRRYLQALGLGARLELQPPAVDLIDGLPPTLGLAQRAQAPASWHTVSTLAELEPVLRLLFGRAGRQRCPRCDGLIAPLTHDQIVGALLKHPEGARCLLEAPLRPGEGVLQEVRRAGFSRVRVRERVVRVEELRPDEVPTRVVVDRVKLRQDRKARLYESVRLASLAGQGVVIAVVNGVERAFVDRPVCVHDGLELPSLEPRLLSPRSGVGGCAACGGAGCEGCAGSGLSEAARSVRWRGERLVDLWQLTADQALAWIQTMQAHPVEEEPLREALARLRLLRSLGLGGLRLGRRVSLLSGGERQRLRLVRLLAAPLGGVVYVLDEPCAGLDAAHAARVVAELKGLCQRGNTVVAVSHHPVVLGAADHVVEFGPGAGRQGGRVVFVGQGVAQADTLTGRWLRGEHRLPPPRARAPRALVHRGGHEVAVGVLGAVVGASGAGKSRWLAAVEGGEGGFERVVHADRAAGRSRRAMPATYIGLWQVMRELLAATTEAKIRGLRSSAFSLHVKGGRCEACKGAGVQRISLDMLPDVLLTCEVCGGRRFASDVLSVRWKGRTASELLEMSAEAARALLAGHPKLDAMLSAMVRVGLGYLPLGQALHTLSGGEARRLNLARELARAARQASTSLYLLDDPTVGLHPADTAHLLEVLQALVDEGATVWLATHDEGVAAVADVVLRL